MPSEIRLLLADDHRLVRDLVAAHLRASATFAVTTAESLSDAVAQIEQHGAFDIILLDFSMPDMTGSEGVARLVSLNGDHPVVLFSGQARPEAVREALARGARGYIPKSTPALDLTEAIHAILQGEIWLPAGFEQGAPGAGPVQLSPREREVLGFIRAGLMNKEIAARLNLSEVTVKMHVRSLCTKLKARNRTQAAMIAETLGIG